MQGDEESIWDFAYMYCALCRQLKPDISEEKVTQHIMTNIRPHLASELRSSGCPGDAQATAGKGQGEAVIAETL